MAWRTSSSSNLRYIAIRIPGKDADSVLNAMQSLRAEFGDKFSQVFKTITVDNGSEFSAFSQVENWGCAVYFAHPYAACFDEVVARAVRVSQPAV